MVVTSLSVAAFGEPAIPRSKPDERERLVKELMKARRGVATARSKADPDLEVAAHAAVDRAKVALGERGPVWWTDGAPDLNRRMAHNTPYADWFTGLG